MRRRELLRAGAALSLGPGVAAPALGAAAFAYPEVGRGPFAFPRDFGAHPDFRTEWWYLTGQMAPPAGSREPWLGLQLTFFRQRRPVDDGNPSRFAPRQLVLAHAAVADPRRGELLQEQCIARTGFGVAEAATADTAVEVDHWWLRRDPALGAYEGRVRGARLKLELTAAPSQELLAQGEAGYSVKGRDPAGRLVASRYYSLPQLALQVRGTVDGVPLQRSGRAWLDHEWSSALLPPQAGGWDWAGFNLDDGSALTVFRVRPRGAHGADAALHAYASLRPPARATQTFAPGEVAFAPRRLWQSPRTRAWYPVAMAFTVGTRRFETVPVMDDQEFDARASSGLIYWEGASELREGGRGVGRGYLELTGYASGQAAPE